MHSAGAVLDEHQDVQSLQQHGVHVEEVDGEDPGRLGAQELPLSFASRTTRRAMLGTVGGRPGLRRLLASYLLAASLRYQASSVAGVTGKTPGQQLRGMSRASAANHTLSAGS